MEEYELHAEKQSTKLIRSLSLNYEEVRDDLRGGIHNSVMCKIKYL